MASPNDVQLEEASEAEKPDSTVYSIDVEGQPPTYTDRDNVAAGTACPPAHRGGSRPSSLYGRVKAAKSESSGLLGFFKAVASILISTVGFTILLAIFLAIPVCMIVMGAIYKDDCPAERMIPIYLIVMGSVWAAKNLFSLVQRFCKKQEERKGEQGKKLTQALSDLVNWFLFAWFVTGCVWIYRTTDRNPGDITANNYCDPALYDFAFWNTTVLCVMIGISFCCMFPIGCVGALFFKKQDQ